MRRAAAIASLQEPSAPRGSLWLPPGKSAAVCFSVDDIHPATSQNTYEAGGDLSSGALGRLARLLQRHPNLKATLCVTPDWKLDALRPQAGFLRHLPWVNRSVQWTRLHATGRFRLDRHPELVHYLNEIERCEIVLHGLTHTHVGPQFAVEFQKESEEQCAAAIQRGVEIFRAAGIRFVLGYAPPGWNAPANLISALDRLDFHFLLSARDVLTPITAEALTAMSGLKGVSLLYPQQIVPGRLVHLTCNFQASSPFERAIEIINLGGALHIKAHIFKTAGDHVMQDGLDELYCNYLDLLFTHLHKRFGERLWWAHVSEISARMRRHS